MRVLVTGGAGFVGSHTVDLLLAKGHQVAILDNLKSGNQNLHPVKDRPYAFFLKDVRDKKGMERVFSAFSPEAVIHLAAQASISTSLSDPAQDMHINAVGTMNVMEMCDIFHVGRLVFASTSAIYAPDPFEDIYPPAFYVEGDASFQDVPDSPYGLSKLTAENALIMLRSKGTTILRYGNVYGPRQIPIGENQVIARAIRHLMFGDPFQVFGDGEQTRDFIYVGDVAAANVWAATEYPDDRIFNIASGKSYSVNRILSMLGALNGVKYYPWAYGEERENRKHVHLGITNAIQAGWQPRMPIYHGLRLTLEWWKDRK